MLLALLPTLSNRARTNTTNIATKTGNISTNATNISANTLAISILEADTILPFDVARQYGPSEYVTFNEGIYVSQFKITESTYVEAGADRTFWQIQSDNGVDDFFQIDPPMV